MKTRRIRISSTHVDRHREKVTRDGLESIAASMHGAYLPLMVEHDVRKPPIGRVVSSEIVKLDDGEYALEGIAQIFEETDTSESLAGDGRKMKVATAVTTTFTVEFDRGHTNAAGKELIEELASLCSPDEQPYEQVKKALGPIPTLIIAAGAFAVGAISNGFFSKLGEDVYEKTKGALVKYFGRERSQEELLAFRLTIEGAQHQLELIVIVENPDVKCIQELFTSKFSGLDELVTTLPIGGMDISRLVLLYQGGRFRLLYAVRSDCVPFKLF